MVPEQGIDSIGTIPQGADEYQDFSTLTLIQQAQLAGKRPFYVVRAYPWDKVGLVEITVRWSEVGRKPLVSTNSYPDVVEEALNFSTNVVQADLTAALGGTPSRGAIRIFVARNEGDTDDFEHWDFKGRVVEVLRGYDGVPEAEWEPVRTDHAKRIRIDENGFWIDLDDPATVFAKTQMQTSRYAGTAVQGGTNPTLQIEGNLNLKDQPRPLAFGVLAGENGNITPITVDEIALVYQCNDRQIQSVDAVRDKGIEIPPANGGLCDITDLGLASVWDWVPIPSTYITDLAKALVRVGSKPEGGTITLDIHGYGPPRGSSDILYSQTIPHAAFDVPATLDAVDYVGSGWVDKIAVP